MRLRFVLLALAVWLSPARAAPDISGPARVADGDGLEIAGTKIRLFGIDAPELDQGCELHDGTPWPCGKLSRAFLLSLTKEKPITCKPEGIDAYGRTLGTCMVDGQDVNRSMVRAGYALAFRRYSTRYVDDEAFARSRWAGLWAGRFIAPWEHRAAGPKTAMLDADHPPEAPLPAATGGVALGLLGNVLPGLPAHAPRPANASAGLEAPAPGCAIKGNVNRRGEQIYHMPGMRDYGKVVMDPKAGKRWFCNEAEAVASGWRRAAR